MGSSTSSNLKNYPDLMLKMILLGDPNVGKTSIINKYIYNEFPVKS
jgi:GTPase SAR1 family protein